MINTNDTNIIVTGAAGFIGSHLCEELLKQGYAVTGIDSMEEPKTVKLKNIAGFVNHDRFKLVYDDVLNIDINNFIRDTDVIFHLAATPGVRTSWGSNFNTYVKNNIRATQYLLEAARGMQLKKLILASTSSVYGTVEGSATEEHIPQPLSPYGVTKLAAEHMSKIYHREFGLPLIILRFFTVYGPRQRPDMAFHRFIKNILTGSEIEIYGDGSQKRDFTYVSDVVSACLRAMRYPEHGSVFNIGSNSSASVNEILEQLELLTGKTARIKYLPAQPGEPRETWANIIKAKQYLHYSPSTKLKDGLMSEIKSIRELYSL